MTFDVDWELLASYFLPDQEFVDFEYELYGRQTFRRDRGVDETTRSPVREDGLDAVIGLLDELCELSEDRGPSGLEGKVRCSSSTTTSQETETVTSDSSVYSSPSLCDVQVRGGDRRCDSGSSGMHVVWPDPVTGCVYGGSCALLVGHDKEQHSCVHTPVQSCGPLSQRCTPTTSRQFTDDTGRSYMPFASRNRWSHKRQKRKRSTKTSRPRKKVSSTQMDSRGSIRRHVPV